MGSDNLRASASLRENLYREIAAQLVSPPFHGGVSGEMNREVRFSVCSSTSDARLGLLSTPLFLPVEPSLEFSTSCHWWGRLGQQPSPVSSAMSGAHPAANQAG